MAQVDVGPPSPSVTTVSPPNLAMVSAISAASSTGIGTGSLDIAVFSGNPPACCAGVTMPASQSTSRTRRPTTSAVLRPAKAPRRIAGRW